MAFILHALPDRFVIERASTPSTSTSTSTSSSGKPATLVIDRKTAVYSLAQNVTLDASAYTQRCDALMGTIKLLSGRYLIIVTESSSVGLIEGCDIRLIKEAKLIPFNAKQQQILTPAQQVDEQHYLSLLHRAIHVRAFHYSLGYDLTLTTQNQADMRADANMKDAPQWKRVDERFWWNRFLQQELIDIRADDFIVPIMNGYVFIQTTTLKQSTIQYVLISRRAWARTGKRFVTRGLDLQGNAANFAETEQIIYVSDPSNPNTHRISSFVQTRGSIPLLWTQHATLKYTPKIVITSEGNEATIAFRRHFDAQIAKYGRQICVSLVNHKGSEGKLDTGYGQMVTASKDNNIRFVSFDFHHECRNMKYENISKLTTELSSEFTNMHWFSGTLHGDGGRAPITIIKRQSGVIRTNCIDCLDRTNVVQSVFAHSVLENQLIAYKLLDENERSHLGSKGFETLFKNVWANNADAMSFQYSGTGALKTDYTRTGKRSWAGALNDGKNSLTRYYLNNFQDGINQDAVDLLLGVYQPKLDEPSPFTAKNSSHQESLPTFAAQIAAAIALLMLVWAWLAPSFLTPYRHFSYPSIALLYLVITGVVIIQLALKKGRVFANKPRLRDHQKHTMSFRR